MASIQVSFHIHVDTLAVNGSSKAQPDRIYGTDVIAVQS